MARPLVINWKAVELLNNAPVQGMRPSLGSLVQRKTADIGCYPFPYMVNEEGIPLDGRTAGDAALPVRVVPYWCSENAFATRYGDTTFNNGTIVWENNTGRIRSKTGGKFANPGVVDFRYDPEMGVTYPTVRVNTAFTSMNSTVPESWISLRRAVYGSGNPRNIKFSGDGTTFDIAKNPLFKAWSGLTFSSNDGETYEFGYMTRYVAGGGTSSPFFRRYNYGCLDQIFNDPDNRHIGLFGLVPADRGGFADFWEGEGISAGLCGGLTGELFLLNAVTGGNAAGSFFVQNAEFPWTDILDGIAIGSTASGRRLAVNLLSGPFIGPDDPPGGLIETMALVFGTQQKIVTLVGTGGTASIRGLDFNNPCSDSFVYQEDSVLGQWGYVVEKIPVGEDLFIGDPPSSGAEFGCNVNTFREFLDSATAGGTASVNHGIDTPLSWMFWRRINLNQTEYEYRPGRMHDAIGEGQYAQLEGIHDYLCYEMVQGATVVDRVYYPVRPITREYYEANVPLFIKGDNISDALKFGLTLDKKYDTGFGNAFAGDFDNSDPVSLKRLLSFATPAISIDTGELPSGLTGVTGFMFPYLIPVASYGMEGLSAGAGNANLEIGGEFPRFEGRWTKAAFGLENEQDGQKLYQYYADGVSSGASLGNDFPYAPDDNSSLPNFKMFSWNALTKIAPLEVSLEGAIGSTVVRSSFKFTASGGNVTDEVGEVSYDSSGNPNTIVMRGNAVGVDPRNYVPSALPVGSETGLTFLSSGAFGPTGSVQSLQCSRYIDVIRIANGTSPVKASDSGITGIAAKRNLIAEVPLGDEAPAFRNFFPGLTINSNNPSRSFDRRTGSPNGVTGFYDTLSGLTHFFFANETGPLKVFGSPYYLSFAEKQAQERGGGGNSNLSLNWWENATNPGPFPNEEIAASILYRLFNPGQDDYWATLEDTASDFRQNSYQASDFSLGTAGIKQALDDGVHPAMVYRFFTSADSLTQLNSTPISDLCAQNWKINGQPCHQYQLFLNRFGNYFNSGQTGCGQYGTDGVDPSNETQKYKDFFYRAKIKNATSGGAIGGGGGGSPAFYAFGNTYYNPTVSPTWNYQNRLCTSGLPDPPLGATLAPFGVTFARAAAWVNVQTINPPLTDARFVRDTIFAYPGNTRTDATSIGTSVATWLDGLLERIYNGYNSAPAGSEQKPILRQVLEALYGEDKVQELDSAIEDTITYRLWAVKPSCVEEWTPQCRALATTVFSPNPGVLMRTAPGVARETGIFNDAVVNDGLPEDSRFSRPLADSDSSFESRSRGDFPSMNDIVPRNEGFMGAVKTTYVQPLGYASNVLATEAQSVPLATISSTVFGKLVSVIDSGGFLRDVNVLSFESGFGTKILGDNATGSVTFSVDGLSMGSLVDVGISGGLVDRDILMYDSESRRWVNVPYRSLNIPEDQFYYQDAPPTEGVVAGSRWINSTTGIEYTYIDDGDSKQWVQSWSFGNIHITGCDNKFFYQNTPPEEGITVGSRWMNSTTGVEYIYINDGNSNQWVQAV